MYRALINVEFYADILCAISNMHLTGHPVNVAALGPHSARLARANFFLQLYKPPERPLSFPPSTPTRVMPESGHFHNWSRVLSSFPSDPGTLVRALHAHQTHLYAGASTATQNPDLVRFSACHPTHEFPSNRARALFNAHFVLLIEYSLDAKLGSKRVCVVQAHVHGSQKGSVMYFPRLKFVASPCTNHFDLDDADCSCIAGCDLTVLITPDSCLQLIWSLCPCRGAFTLSPGG